MKDHLNPMHIGINSKKIDITSEKDNNLISKKICKLIKQGDVFLLYGEIGIGKTTFVKNLINCLQIKSKEKETEIPSPTSVSYTHLTLPTIYSV